MFLLSFVLFILLCIFPGSTQCTFHTPMARYSSFVLKVPLNTNESIRTFTHPISVKSSSKFVDDFLTCPVYIHTNTEKRTHEGKNINTLDGCDKSLAKVLIVLAVHGGRTSVIKQAVLEAATICPATCKLTFDLLTLKVVSESRVTWPTSVLIIVFLGLSVLDLSPMYATDRRVRRASSLNAPAMGAGHNKRWLAAKTA